MDNYFNNKICTKYPLLSSISKPDDVKKFTEKQIPLLCTEIRRFLVECVSENGGHLASNLGVVELTVALYRIMDIEYDHLLFDVGHQSYVHKILSGRWNEFDKLRQSGGVSGFPKREESRYDAFGTGHGSTALSAALGFATADRLSGNHIFSIAVIGDGAYTGGMVHEALNNCDKNLPLIVILNENEMSISPNIGRFASLLAKMRNVGYYKTKTKTKQILEHIPLLGKIIAFLLSHIKSFFKKRLYRGNYFTDMGLQYLGPADGNDYKAVSTLLKEAKSHGGTTIIHLKTVKGKGYVPAEKNPSQFHNISVDKSAIITDLSHVFGTYIVDMATDDEKVCAITAAMKEGTGLLDFSSKFPNRFYDVGMAEEHAVTFAAGLAAAGYKPFVAIYSTFLQRSYDQILHDVALQQLPVVFCIDRVGLNEADGATHHGLFDVSFLSSIPNIEIYTPATTSSLLLALKLAANAQGPVAIRYPHMIEEKEILKNYGPIEQFSIVRKYEVSSHSDGYILVHGRMTAIALRAQQSLKECGVFVGIIMAEKIKPYQDLAKAVMQIVSDRQPILCVEEEIKEGGFGMNFKNAVEQMSVNNYKIDILAPTNSFVIPKSGENIWHAAGVDCNQIMDAVFRLLK